MHRAPTLLLVLISCWSAQAETFGPRAFLDPPPEIPADPEAPIATAPNGVVANWHEGTVYLRKPALVQQLASFRLAARPTAMAFTANDRFLVTGHADGTVHLIPARQSATPSWTVHLKGPIGSVATSPVNHYVAATSANELVLLDLGVGKERGKLPIDPSAPAGGPAMTYAAFAGVDWIGVVEKRGLAFVPVDRFKGLMVDEVKRVKLGKAGAAGAPSLKRKGLFVVGGKSIFLMGPRTKRPRAVVKAAGAPLRIASGPLLLAALQKDKKSVLFFDGNKGFKRAGEYAVETRTIEQIAVSWNDRFLYCATKKDDGTSRLEAVDATSAALRRGMLPDYALGLRFGPDGSVLCLSPRGEGTDRAAVDRFRYDPAEDALERVGSTPGELIRHDGGHALIRAPDGGLVLVSRVSGEAKTVTPPPELADQLACPRYGFVVFSDEERHTVWDPVRGQALGAWSAPSVDHLAVAPDGKRVVILSGRSLRCEEVGGKKLWETTLGQAGARVDLSADGGKALVPEVGVYSMNDGEQLYVLPPVVSQFSSDGQRVLIDQSNRSKDAARVQGADSGQLQHSVRYLGGKIARVRSGIELIDMDPEARWLLLRRHGGEQRGLWIYEREN